MALKDLGKITELWGGIPHVLRGGRWLPMKGYEAQALRSQTLWAEEGPGSCGEVLK